uniref:Multimerin-2-like n=1 Tax=Crassostrea virginica TaxID=6565 RepID=A0A8B8ADQ0_CRAVI|nr:multimerin-2-like [Crassostrea virginica]
MLVRISLLIFIFVRANALSSLLTDGDNKTSNTLENKDHAWNDVDFLRHMINQETVIRLALVKNVQALVGDVIQMKKSITTSELTISSLQQTVGNLNRRVDSLEQENKELKNSSVVLQDRVLNLEARLNDMNNNVSSLNENLEDSRKENDEKRQQILNKTNVVLDDIKMEVRYLSVTLFDFKDHTETSDKIRDSNRKTIESRFNSSIEVLQTGNQETKSDVDAIKASIRKLEEAQTNFRENIADNLNSTKSEFESELKKSEYERLKLSASVSSLETFRLNMSKSKCESSEIVAFTAIVTQDMTSQNGQTLVFPHIISNVGGGYNGNTGVFTAPRDGVYVFFCKITGQDNPRDMVFDIILNGSAQTQHLVYGRSANPYRTSSNSIVLQLTHGDRVWINMYWGGKHYSISAGGDQTFSGYLL